MSNTRTLWIITAFVIASWSIQTTGQSPSTASVGPRINVPFFANDEHDKPISDLTQADIAILDNKKPPQSIVGLRRGTESPLRLGVLIDTSNSERASGLYPGEVQAASGFPSQVLSETDDKVFVEKFDIVPTASQFMSKDELPVFKINLTPAGPTALYDAVHFACDERLKADPAQPARRVIVLISDGGDNQSHIDHEKAIAAAQETGVVIFAVSTGDDALGHSDSHGNITLKQFADQTGGAAFLHLNRKDIPKAFASIKDQIDNMYVLSYVPADPAQNNQRRSLELRSASNRKLRLRAPKAYYLNVASQ